MLGHGVTTIEAKSGYGLDLQTELRLIEVAYRLGLRGPGRGRADVARRPRGPARVPRPPGRHGGVRPAHSSRSSCPASRPRAGRASATCSARGVFSADQSRRILEAAAGSGWGRGCTPTSWRRRGGAELAAELGAASADHLATPSRGGIDALAAAAAAIAPSSRRCCRRRPGSYEGPPRAGPDVHRRGVPVALGTDFNPGTSPTASLPLAMTVACLKLGLTPDEALAR